MSKYINIFANDIDKETKEQFENCCNHDFVVAGALMPDAHRGYVAPIGSVLLTKDKVVPAWVGYDIGCGVTAVKLNLKNSDESLLNLIKENTKEIFNEVFKTIPMGLGKLNHNSNLHRDTILKFRELLASLEQKDHDDEIFDWVRRKALSNLGTLGEGNHFIELDESEGETWLVIHSGSRNIGHKVAQKYMIKSSGKDKGFEETFPLDVVSDLGKEYLAILDFGLEFALLNRLEMVNTFVDCLEAVLSKQINFEVWTNKNHNHAILDDYEGDKLYFHRKGATPAKKGERGVIPGTMRDGSYLVEGLGNKDFLFSSSHGAGRKLSRKKARDTITLDKFQEEMKDVVACVSDKTIDESPDAYKNIDDVMSLQKDSVKIIHKLKPIINWKG